MRSPVPTLPLTGYLSAFLPDLNYILARHKRAHVVVKAFLKVNLLVHRLLVRGYRSAAATCARAGLIPVRASGSKSHRCIKIRLTALAI